MMENSVPDWYIESCKRIKYMFPKAHAVAYVMMSYRIAYFKVYYPAAFYAVHHTIKVDFFNAKVNLAGMESVLDRMDQIRKMGDEATNKEKDEYLVYEVVYEMYARGIEFLPAETGKISGGPVCGGGWKNPNSVPRSGGYGRNGGSESGAGIRETARSVPSKI